MTAALIAFLLKHETLVGWGAVLLAAVAAGGLLTHRLDDSRATRLQVVATAAQASAAAGEAQARLASAASAAVETARTREVTVTHAAEETADALAHAPDAGSPLPPDVLRDWSAGIGRLRDEARAARALSPDPGGAGAARPVPRALTCPPRRASARWPPFRCARRRR